MSEPLSQTAGAPNPDVGRMSVVHQSPLLRVTSLGDPESPGLFLCFTGIAHKMGGIGAEEFVGSTRLPGYSALFISDLTRSWYNAFEPALLLDAIAHRTAGKRIVSVGNSMGGFGAVWVSRFLPVQSAIAFAPQFSVHPEIVPDEQRWWEHRSAITNWRTPSLQGYFNSSTRYFTINGDADNSHWSRFPDSPNCEHLYIPGSGHGAAAVLKEYGVLSETIASCVEGKSPFALIQRSGLKTLRIRQKR